MPGAPDETPEDSAEQSRAAQAGHPPPVQAGIIDERFAANVKEVREEAGMSQSELGRRMAALGWPWHPQTVQRVEGGQRKVSVGEAEAIAGILNTSVLRLTTIGQQAAFEHMLAATTYQLRGSYRQIVYWAATLAHQRRQLALTISEAQRSPYRNDEIMAELLTDARAALTLNSAAAAAEGQHEDDEFVEANRERRQRHYRSTLNGCDD